MAGHDTCCRRRVIFTMAGPVPGPGPSRKEGTRLCAALDYADGISARGVSFVLRALNCWLGKKKIAKCRLTARRAVQSSSRVCPAIAANALNTRQAKSAQGQRGRPNARNGENGTFLARKLRRRP